MDNLSSKKTNFNGKSDIYFVAVIATILTIELNFIMKANINWCSRQHVNSVNWCSRSRLGSVGECKLNLEFNQEKKAK
jgi:hypothetical protein